LSKVRGKSDITTYRSNTSSKAKSNRKIPDKRVLIFIPSYLGLIDSQSVESIAELMIDCKDNKGYKFFLRIGKRMHTHNARNQAVDWALNNNMDYILWLDDDMVIPPGSKLFTRLLKRKKDIVAPLFFVRRAPYLPLLFKRNIRAEGRYTTFDNIMDYPKGLVRCDGVGFGCVLTKIEVFKKLKPPYFVMGDTFGEDLYFCNLAINSGFKIYCDTTLPIGHIGDAEVVFEGTYKKNEGAAKLFVKQKRAADEENSKKFIRKVDIIMPCYHNFELTKTAIESIINNTSDVDWKLIVINDGADRQITKYVKRISKKRKNIILEINKQNIGWIKSINQGIKLSTAPYVLLLNNDIEIPQGANGWLARLTTVAMTEDIGAVGPTSDYVMGIQHIGANNTIKVAEHFTKFLIGFCMLLKREAIDKAGLLDERFGIGGNDDLDYSISLRKAGYKLKICRDVFIKHEGTASLGKVFDDVGKQDKATRKILVKKWGKKTVDELFKMDTKFLMTGEGL